jgi:hypothetical protein
MGKAKKAITSARDLYKHNDTFRAGIAAWVEERRCDLRLVDLLLEYGLTSQAEGARWAATEPDRRFSWDGKKRKKCGPFPCCYEGNFFWYDCESTSDVPQDCHDVPRKHFGREVNYRTNKFKSAADAILFLLDNWKPETPAGAGKKRRPKRK